MWACVFDMVTVVRAGCGLGGVREGAGCSLVSSAVAVGARWEEGGEEIPLKAGIILYSSKQVKLVRGKVNVPRDLKAG